MTFIRGLAKHGVEIRVTKNKNDAYWAPLQPKFQICQEIQSLFLWSLNTHCVVFQLPTSVDRTNQSSVGKNKNHFIISHSFLAQKSGSLAGWFFCSTWNSRGHLVVFRWQVTLDRTKLVSLTHLATWKRWGKAQLGLSARAPTHALSSTAVSQ